MTRILCSPAPCPELGDSPIPFSTEFLRAGSLSPDRPEFATKMSIFLKAIWDGLSSGQDKENMTTKGVNKSILLHVYECGSL